MEKVTEENRRPTLTELVRLKFGSILDPIASFFLRIGLKPNTMTILGLVGNTVGAYFLAMGWMTVGGIIILLMGPIDALDGTMARLKGEPTAFGAFVDSVTDRYSELIIFGGLFIFYLNQGQWLGASLAYISAAGSILVSYVRARAQSLGYDSRIGVLTRMERYLVLAPALVINLPLVGLWIIAIFSNLTAFQRILDVRRQVHSD